MGHFLCLLSQVQANYAVMSLSVSSARSLEVEATGRDRGIHRHLRLPVK